MVSLPGLDVSPGDLFVSNGAADMLNGSNYSGKIQYDMYFNCIVFHSVNQVSDLDLTLSVTATQQCPTSCLSKPHGIQ